MAPSLWDALVVNHDARLLDDDDYKEFVDKNQIGERPLMDSAKQFGVSKQAVLLWRRRAGIQKSEPTDKKKRIADAIAACEPFCIADVKRVASEFGVGASTVERYAREAGIKRKRFVSRRRPSDKELVGIAVNKTWDQFAESCGMSLAYLRAYVYKRPELARILRAVMVRKAPNKKG